MNYKELLYKLAFEEHEIWIKHIKELMGYYKPSLTKEDKVEIGSEDYAELTKYFLTKYEEWPLEYRQKMIDAVSNMYNILIENDIPSCLRISKEELLRLLCESEQNRRKSWLSFEEGVTSAEFSKESYQKYWPEEMATSFDKLSLGLQYWDLDEVKKRLALIMAAAKIDLETKRAIEKDLQELMSVRNPEPSTGGSYDMYNAFEDDLKKLTN